MENGWRNVGRRSEGKTVGKCYGESFAVLMWGLKFKVKLPSMIVIISSCWQLQKLCVMHLFWWCDPMSSGNLELS